MITPLITLRVRGRRDVVQLRQHARQLAALLGFSERCQALIAAASFAIARQAWHTSSRAAVRFQLRGDLLEVAAVRGGRKGGAAVLPRVLRLERRLPAGGGADRHDLAWMAKQIVRMTPLDVFAEVQRQNAELLAVLQELEQRPPAPAAALHAA